MLARTGQALYWIGRYMERAEFTVRLLEATIRLHSLVGAGGADLGPWQSALDVAGAGPAYAATGESLGAFNVSRYLTLADENPNSVRASIQGARENARSARNDITRELWEAINRTWTNVRDRSSPGGAQATNALVDALKADARGFEGALSRMLRSEAYWLMRLGAVIERADNTARLLDVKYYLILPEGEQIGGVLDRDQWTTILQTVSARNAYRFLYRQTPKPWLVAELLIFRQELPRSLASAAAEAVALLAAFGDRTGRQGEADRLARRRLNELEEGDIDTLFRAGLHESLQRFIGENAALDAAIAQQFRFV
ncbi:alpha-E domain-containing protein [Allosphingosinicella indica]|uniref:Uncharacterized conserved protein, Alpha-E superfamily n=1 Tax=Allosphingosinicella indica TaxID=941907 RepID=A0A1X7G548_9SPHN|nr:alpha-E domain-containing protein [Allosphingosinicella indica]SMF64098.1 Uncharacterized conserved protein, Alpha-E superfamily [Allosphingosinicella indica]